MKVTVDAKPFTLTPAGSNSWDLSLDGSALGTLVRTERDEVRQTMQYRNGRAYSGTISKVTAVYWLACLPGHSRGRLSESRAAAIRWLRDPPAWWVEKMTAEVARG
jgi:hypothetical protein